MSLSFSYTNYFWLLIAQAVIVFVLGVYAWRHRTSPAAAAFAGLSVCWLVWTISSGLELFSASPAAKLFWFMAQALIKLPLVTMLLVFALLYAGMEKWLTRTVQVLLVVQIVLMTILIVVDPWTHWLWAGFRYTQQVIPTFGPLNWATQAYGNLLFIPEAIALIRMAGRSPTHRLPVAMILGVDLLSRLGYALDVLQMDPFTPVDAALLFANVTALVFFLVLFRFRILDVLPVGRETAIERLDDGVLILDTENRVVDLNPAARKALGIAGRSTTGHPAAQVLAARPELLGLIQGDASIRGEIPIGEGPNLRFFQVHVSPLLHPRGLKLGRLILLQDVTEQKRARDLLEQQRWSLATLSERERMARELHDSTGQVLGYIGFQVEAIRKQLDTGQAEAANEQLAQLARIAREAHADMREYILNLRAAPSAQQPFFTALRSHLDSFTANFNIPVALNVGDDLGDRSFSPDAQLQVFRIIQEALSNTRKHAQARHVQVAFTADGLLTHVIVRDDGCGFDPDHSLAQGGSHFGLQFMRERAEQMGGSLRVDSAPGAGTCVVVEIPTQKGSGHA